MPQHYQRKTPSPLRPQEATKIQTNRAATPETIFIKMAEGKNRFQIGAFLDTPVTLPMWQLLDRSSQLRVQLARAIASSRPIRRRKKSAGPNPVGTAAAVSKFWTSPVIKTVAHEDKEIICLYIDAWIDLD